MTTYYSPGFTARYSGQTHGEVRSTNRMHEIIAIPATLATGDIVNVGYLPVNAVVVGLNAKAASQLDTNATATLAFDIGTRANPQLFNAVSAVGRAAGVSVDTTLLPAGRLYKNSSGAKQLVIATVHAAAATPAPGSLELEMSYFVEELPGSPA
jgi:hypothetical protein